MEQERAFQNTAAIHCRAGRAVPDAGPGRPPWLWRRAEVRARCAARDRRPPAASGTFADMSHEKIGPRVGRPRFSACAAAAGQSGRAMALEGPCRPCLAPRPRVAARFRSGNHLEFWPYVAIVVTEAQVQCHQRTSQPRSAWAALPAWGPPHGRSPPSVLCPARVRCATRPCAANRRPTCPVFIRTSIHGCLRKQTRSSRCTARPSALRLRSPHPSAHAALTNGQRRGGAPLRCVLCVCCVRSSWSSPSDLRRVGFRPPICPDVWCSLRDQVISYSSPLCASSSFSPPSPPPPPFLLLLLFSSSSFSFFSFFRRRADH